MKAKGTCWKNCTRKNLFRVEIPEELYKEYLAFNKRSGKVSHRRVIQEFVLNNLNSILITQIASFLGLLLTLVVVHQRRDHVCYLLEKNMKNLSLLSSKWLKIKTHWRVIKRKRESCTQFSSKERKQWCKEQGWLHWKWLELIDQRWIETNI